MTESDREELFVKLGQLSRQYPHWRIGQLIANVAGWSDADVWDVEDDQLFAAAEAHLSKVRQRDIAKTAGC